MRHKHSEVSDADIIVGIGNNEVAMERHLFEKCRRYYQSHRGDMLPELVGASDADDLFQVTLLKVWTEIETGQIFVSNGNVMRRDKNGNVRRMQASLCTYFIGVAKLKSYELLREEAIYAETEASSTREQADAQYEDSLQEWIVEKCVMSMSEQCRRLLTMYYYENRSLNDIVKMRGDSVSYNGTKTAKSKCLSTLKGRIEMEFNRHNLKPL